MTLDERVAWCVDGTRKIGGVDFVNIPVSVPYDGRSVVVCPVCRWYTPSITGVDDAVTFGAHDCPGFVA